MFVLIGCPVYDRSWILSHWFDAIKNQDYGLDNIGFIFNVSIDDTETIDALNHFKEQNSNIRYFSIIENNTEIHSSHPEGQRHWSHEKYKKMANLRNQILDIVSEVQPDRFYSLDSDILLENPRTISELVQISAKGTGVDAVSTLSFMTPTGTEFPSTMSWVGAPGDIAFRTISYPFGSLFKSDIIMASVMMNPQVYKNVRYQMHRQGEDLGWSLNAGMKGYDLYLASYLYTPHIMSKAALEHYLQHGDERRNVAKVCNG